MSVTIPEATTRAAWEKICEDRVAAERERCAKIAEEMPDRVLVRYDRPGSPPGNTYVHISGQKLTAKAIRDSSQ